MSSDQTVSLVIPGRNCASTIRQCLEAVVPMLDTAPLREIIFVDDGSTDETAQIVAGFPVTCAAGNGRGPGAARNIGYKAAKGPLVWFVDSDCVTEHDALALLLPHLEEQAVAAVGGSYGNMESDSLLACLIHEEIVERHLAMPRRVNFLATFNVVYRKSILEEVGGFDERLLKGQDADLAWRVHEAGHELAFEINSRVRHYHPVSLRSYLNTQMQQGYWRVWLHLGHRGHARGDSYSKLLDHVQPPLAMIIIASLPLLLYQRTCWVPSALTLLLLACQLPLTWKLLKRKRQIRYLGFSVMSLVRAFWRGVGMTAGTISAVASRMAKRENSTR